MDTDEYIDTSEVHVFSRDVKEYDDMTWKGHIEYGQMEILSTRWKHLYFQKIY